MSKEVLETSDSSANDKLNNVFRRYWSGVEYMVAKGVVCEAMEQIDFSRIHKVMEALDWRWGDAEVPSTEKLRDEVLRQIACCLEGMAREETPGYYCSSGGFDVHCEIDHNEGRVFRIEVKFNIEEAEAEFDFDKEE